MKKVFEAQVNVINALLQYVTVLQEEVQNSTGLQLPDMSKLQNVLPSVSNGSNKAKAALPEPELELELEEEEDNLFSMPPLDAPKAKANKPKPEAEEGKVPGKRGRKPKEHYFPQLAEAFSSAMKAKSREGFVKTMGEAKAALPPATGGGIFAAWVETQDSKFHNILKTV